MVFFRNSFALTLFFFVSQRTVQSKNDKLLTVPIISTLHIPDELNLNQHFKQLESSENDSVLTPTNNQILKVVAPVRMGNSQEFKQVLVDTGSAILWVGGEQPYEVGPNTEDINATFSIAYGIGSASGPVYRDTVTIGQATAKSQIIGAANTTSGLTLVRPIDGILGLGTSQSNTGQVSGLESTPTFVETLVSQGSIDRPVFGLYIAPLESTNEDGQGETVGEISFGGPNPAKFTGEMEWLQQLPPFDFRWEFNVSGMSFGNFTSNDRILGRTDSGNLGIGMPFDQFLEIRSTYSAQIIRSGPLVGFLSFPAPPPAELYTTYPSLTVTLGSQEFSIDPKQYLIPSSLYTQLSLNDTAEVPVDPQNPQGDKKQVNVVHTWFCSGGTGRFSFGQKWLEGVYTAYDMENRRIGFARPI